MDTWLPRLLRIDPAQAKLLPLCCFVDWLQVSGHFLEIFVRYIVSGIADLVNDTLLNFGLWIAGSNRFGEAAQIIHTNNKDILDTTISEIIQYAEPKLTGFILTNPHAQHIFVPIQINSNHHVGSLVYNSPRPASL
ncbi:hypothetical protein D3C77_581540 [compost metagenome]